MINESEISSPRVRRKRLAKRTAILDAAMDLIEDKGLEGLTLQDVAAAMDFAPAALYRYFPSKDALVGELQRRVVEQFGEYVSAARLWAKQAAKERRLSTSAARLLPLVAIAGFYREFAGRNEARFGLIASSLGDPRKLIDDDQARRVLGEATPIFEAVAADVAAAQRAKVLRDGDPFLRAVSFWAALHGVMQLRKLSRLDPKRLAIEPLADELVRGLLRGWGATRVGVGKAQAAAADLEWDALAALVESEDEET
ncbi:MAG: helix-turn-helix transcriptional regulator [Deltaproteobacteria bacterium]|nr:helix-turn-helix transcriptional regulator [Deltaproteobacteria bacterium]